MYSDIHPTTVFKFCPKCGSANFSTLGDRAKQCKNCSFTYYFNTSAAVAALIFDKKGRVLFARRAIQPHLGMLDLPGGFIEPMETAEEALSRELHEELGVEVSGMTYFCSFPNEYPYSGLSVFTLDLMFKVTVKSLEEMTPMDDISACEFYFPDEVNMDEVPSYSMKKIIEKLRSE